MNVRMQPRAPLPRVLGLRRASVQTHQATPVPVGCIVSNLRTIFVADQTQPPPSVRVEVTTEEASSPGGSSFREGDR